MKSGFLHSTFPICFVANDKIFVFQKGKFMIYDTRKNKFDFVVNYYTSYFNWFIYKFDILSRIFRKGVRCGCLLSNNIVLVCLDKTIFEIDLKAKSLSCGFKAHDESRPLAFTKLHGIEGFDNGIYFGGYKSNPSKGPISIFRRISKDNWVVVFTFAEGEIEHVHNIVSDPYKNVVYIFTGDFENSSAIWLAENNFTSVKAVVRGDQMYRACVGFSTLDGLVYATDTPFSKNSIRLLNQNEGLWNSSLIQNINGPSIYGCIWNDKFVFSTSVEGDGRDINLWYKLFGRLRGKGVLDNHSVMYIGDHKIGFEQMYKVRKDILPFYLFQFGVLIFPAGDILSDFLPVYHIATRKYSMGTKLLVRQV